MKLIKKIKSSINIKEQSNFTATIALVLAIIIVLNFISFHVFARFDLTENKDYSISKVSRKTVSNLEDIVKIKVYFSKKLPPQYMNVEQEIKDIIEEYETYSGGKVEVEFIDPSPLDDYIEELAQSGLSPLQFNVMRNDSYEVVKGFMGMIISHGSKQEVIPIVSSSKNLEYAVTTSIKKLIAKSKMSVGLLSSHGTIDATKYATMAYKNLEDLYRVKMVDLKNEEETMDDIDTLVMLGPREAFAEAELKKIDSFVMSGRPLIILLDGVYINPSVGPMKNETGLDTVLNAYGLSLDKNLVSDISNAMVSFPSGFFNINMNYPLWPKITKDNLSKDSATVSSLESLTLPWVSSIGILEENISRDELNVVVLAKSTKDACTQTDNFNIDPNNKNIGCAETKQYDLAVSLMGKVKSAFEENREEDAKIILVADSDFATDQFFSQNSDNTIFFQNMVDSVTLDEDLISIRSQGVTERPIKKTKKTTKEFIRYANIFGITVLVLIFGLLRYFLRRKSKLSDEI